ncbi:MAG: hypothetical protein R3F59_20370 [Myxococcota bacterium]
MPRWPSLLVATAALWSAAAPARACDPELLELTAKNLASQHDPTLRLKKLAGSLAESCSFVPSLRDALGTVPSLPPASRPALERKAVTSDAAAWEAACPGGLATYEKAAAQSGADRAATLYADCNLKRFAFTDQAGLAAGDGLPFLTILVAQHFDANRVAPALAQPLLRGLAGISAAAGAGADDPWATARTEVDAVKGRAFDAIPPAQWKAVADKLLPLCERLRGRPDTERLKNRQLEYDTCATAGFAADNAGAPAEPLFRPLAGQQVNWGYYLAAATARPDPTLLTRTADQTVRSSVQYCLDQLKSGKFPAP